MVESSWNWSAIRVHFTIIFPAQWKILPHWAWNKPVFCFFVPCTHTKINILCNVMVDKLSKSGNTTLVIIISSSYIVLFIHRSHSILQGGKYHYPHFMDGSPLTKSLFPHTCWIFKPLVSNFYYTSSSRWTTGLWLWVLFLTRLLILLNVNR